MRDISSSETNLPARRGNIKKALIIGGGIAGPVTAMALQKAGIDSVVYEAYAGTAEGVGGAMSIAPNGLNALKVLGLDHAVRSAGIATTRMVMQNYRGRVLGEIPTLHGLPESCTIGRGDLYAALRRAALDRGIRIEHGKRLIGAVDDGVRVTAHFDDGSAATGDILIGADGIRSAVRPLIDPRAPAPRYTGLIGLGGFTTGTGVADTNGAMHFVFGKRAFFGYQIEKGVALWFGNVAHREPLTAAQARAIPASKWLRDLRALYADDKTPALQILDAVFPGDLIVSGALEDIPVVPTWHKGRIVLVGDSAHATSPSSGQGASLAVESAIELAKCLRSNSDAQTAFRAYESLRRDRVERIIAGAAKVNNDKAAGPVARVIRDLMFPIAMRTFYSPEKTFGFMHRHTVTWETTTDPIGSGPLRRG